VFDYNLGVGIRYSSILLGTGGTIENETGSRGQDYPLN
jgi:hypothetical protein